MRPTSLREGTYSCLYTLLYLKWIAIKLYSYHGLLYSTWNSAQYYVAACLGGEFGRERVHVYAWLSPSAVHLELSQHR